MEPENGGGRRQDPGHGVAPEKLVRVETPAGNWADGEVILGVRCKARVADFRNGRLGPITSDATTGAPAALKGKGCRDGVMLTWESPKQRPTKISSVSPDPPQAGFSAAGETTNRHGPIGMHEIRK